jgi:hypothetical protein
LLVMVAELQMVYLSLIFDLGSNFRVSLINL